MPSTSPVRVRASSPTRLAPPKSVSLADAGGVLCAGCGNEHVLRLDVAMDDPARVRVREGSDEREADLEDLLVARARRRRSGCGERLAVDQLGDQVEGSPRPRTPRTARRSRGATGERRRAPRGLARSLSPSGPRRMRLTATSRWSSSSRARQTSPKPPGAEPLEQAVAPEHELAPRRRAATAGERGGSAERVSSGGGGSRRAGLWTRVCGDSTGSRVRRPRPCFLPSPA